MTSQIKSSWHGYGNERTTYNGYTQVTEESGVVASYSRVLYCRRTFPSPVRRFAAVNMRTVQMGQGAVIRTSVSCLQDRIPVKTTGTADSEK